MGHNLSWTVWEHILCKQGTNVPTQSKIRQEWVGVEWNSQ